MTPEEYRLAVYKLAKIATNRDRWGPELFKSLQRSCYEGLSHERRTLRVQYPAGNHGR